MRSWSRAPPRSPPNDSRASSPRTALPARPSRPPDFTQRSPAGGSSSSPATTVIHDEAALASTREQIRLLREVEASGARLIAVGDPRQNQPVGAGGLWTRLEHTTRRAGAHVELTRNQRARDPADRRDQALFREGRAELAIRGYAARDRVHLHPDQQRAEDEALDAAASRPHQRPNDDRHRADLKRTPRRTQRPRPSDPPTTSATRRPARPRSWPALRPTRRRPVQIRHTIQHDRRAAAQRHQRPDHERRPAIRQRRSPPRRTAPRHDSDRDEIAQADLRLAYVQHPFPAQGHTTDTAHLIVTAQRHPGGLLRGTHPRATRNPHLQPPTRQTAPPRSTGSRTSPIASAAPNQSYRRSRPRSPTKPRSPAHSR